jgi:hypothetical protein
MMTECVSKKFQLDLLTSLTFFFLVFGILCSNVKAENATSTDTLKGPGRSLQHTLGRAPVFATENTVDAVKWMAKRRQFTINGVPYGVTGLPFIFYNPNTGWNSGARIHWADYRRRPYRYKLTLHSQRSTEGKRKHIFRLKVPRISGTGFGIRLRASTERNLQTRYYGLGNNSEFKSEWIDPKSNAFKSKTYYFYELKEDPKLTINFLRHIHGPLTLSMGFGLENTKISSPGPQSFLAEQGAPDGVKDGFTGFVGLALEWDSRDDEVLPISGAFHEWSYENSRNSIVGLFFDEIDFRRYTATHMFFISPSSQYTSFAFRGVFEALTGEVPLYAYGEIGGGQRVKGLGGSHTLRGFDTQRFTDDIRFFSNVEVRQFLFDRDWFGQFIELFGALYCDFGRVWADVGDVSLRDMHWSRGAALRLSWDRDLLMRVEVGWSAEQVGVFFDWGNSF